jgi:hypothetical protein
MAKAYGKTPFDLVSEDFAAYTFNRAIHSFGTRVDNLLDEQEEYKDGEKIRYRKKYTVEQAIKKASENPNSPKEKFKGYAALFAGLG